MWRHFAVDPLQALCKIESGRHAAWHILVNAEGDALRIKTDAAVNWQIVSSPLVNRALPKCEWLLEVRPVEGHGHVDAAFASVFFRQGHRENNNDCPSRGWAVCVDKVDVRILRDVLEGNICERTPIVQILTDADLDRTPPCFYWICSCIQIVLALEIRQGRLSVEFCYTLTLGPVIDASRVMAVHELHHCLPPMLISIFPASQYVKLDAVVLVLLTSWILIASELTAHGVKQPVIECVDALPNSFGCNIVHNAEIMRARCAFQGVCIVNDVALILHD